MATRKAAKSRAKAVAKKRRTRVSNSRAAINPVARERILERVRKLRRPRTKREERAYSAAVDRARSALERLGASPRAAREAVTKVQRESESRVAAAKKGWETRTKKQRKKSAAKPRGPTKKKKAAKKVAKKRVVKPPARRPTAKRPAKRTRRERFAAAITRAKERLLETRFPRKPPAREARKAMDILLHEERKQALVQTLQNAGFSLPSIRAQIGALTKRKQKQLSALSQRHADVLGGTLHGSRPQDHVVLRVNLEQESQAFRDFVEAAAEMDMGIDEAIDYWFSPEV